MAGTRTRMSLKFSLIASPWPTGELDALGHSQKLTEIILLLSSERSLQFGNLIATNIDNLDVIAGILHYSF